MRKTKSSTLKHVSEYVDHRTKGTNKQQSALLADYSESTARVPSLIESTQAYALIVTQLLTENGNQMRQIQANLGQYVGRNDADALFTMDILSKTMLRMGQLEKLLAPQVTVKETTDKHGNKTRSVWGNTTASALQTPEDKE